MLLLVPLVSVIIFLCGQVTRNTGNISDLIGSLLNLVGFVEKREYIAVLGAFNKVETLAFFQKLKINLYECGSCDFPSPYLGIASLIHPTFRK